MIQRVGVTAGHSGQREEHEHGEQLRHGLGGRGALGGGHPGRPCVLRQQAFAVQQGRGKPRDNNQNQPGASDRQARPRWWGRRDEARGESACGSGSLQISRVGGQGTASGSGVK